MGSWSWTQIVVLLLLALVVVHFRNSQQAETPTASAPVSVTIDGPDAIRPERLTASLADLESPFTGLKPGGSVPIGQTQEDRDRARRVIPIVAASPTASAKPGLLDGPWYRVEPSLTDDEYRLVIDRHRLLCNTRKGQNFWLCQDNALTRRDLNAQIEPSVQCEDCYGHVMPKVHNSELGSLTWN